MVFVLYACRYHQKGQYAIGEQTILENLYTTDHLVKNEAYMAHSVIAEEMSDEKGDLLEKDEKIDLEADAKMFEDFATVP